MTVIKNGNGVATHQADLAVVNLNLRTISETKEPLLEKYLLDYKLFTKKLESFIRKEKLSSKLSFNDYSSAEHRRKIEKKNKSGEKEISYVTEYYYITGCFTLEIPFVDGNKKSVARLISLIEDLNKEITVTYDIHFTLQEDTKAKVRAQATNNALDNIWIEVKQIAEHLGYTDIRLIEINFNPTSSANNYDKCVRKQASFDSMSSSEKVKLLDDMLESKDIALYSSFTSTWHIN